MPFNGSGTFTLPAGNPVSSNTAISSVTHNATNSDIAAALTNCFTRDGQSTATGNINFGGYKITGLAKGTIAGDSVRFEQVAKIDEATGVNTDIKSITGLTTMLPVNQGGTGVTTSTGTGNTVLSTSPTLVTPILGTPTSGNLANCTGLPIVAGTTGTLSVARGGTGVTTSTGSGDNVLATSPTLVTPILGTPTSGNLANCTFPTLNQNTTGTAAKATNLAAGTANQIPYQSAANTTAFLPTGTAGYALISSGSGAAASWTNLATTYLALSGGIITGGLVLSSPPTAAGVINIDTSYSSGGSTALYGTYTVVGEVSASGSGVFCADYNYAYANNGSSKTVYGAWNKASGSAGGSTYGSYNEASYGSGAIASSSYYGTYTAAASLGSTFAYGVYATTSGAGTNYGVYVNASGAGTNYGVYVNAGINVFKDKTTIQAATAIPAGGTAAVGLNMSSTANFGVYFGSGVPTLSAAQGSLYMRTDGSSTSTRMYVNTNGSTGWTNLVTAA